MSEFIDNHGEWLSKWCHGVVGRTHVIWIACNGDQVGDCWVDVMLTQWSCWLKEAIDSSLPSSVSGAECCRFESSGGRSDGYAGRYE